MATSKDQLADRLETRLALAALAPRYAQALDRVDPSAMVKLFCSDGSVRIFDPADAIEPVRTFQGAAELAELPKLTGAYARTFHFVGNATYDIGDAEATGEVYCIAHHLSSARHGGTNLATYLRYQDAYSLGDDLAWRFKSRAIRVDWSEVRLTSTKRL
jgi:hypothetical protein